MFGVMLAAAFIACASAEVQKKQPNPDAAVIADFLKRVNEYVAVHKKANSNIPSLPKEANPEQIDQHQRALGKLIAEDRKTAKRGDIFTPGMEKITRKVLADVFRGPSGDQLKREIFEEYSQRDIVPKVNGRYPDEVPISTVPPGVLEALPKLPEALEYRFVGRYLILLDPRAHVIADYIERAIP